ncbi:5-oxoprolinase subunit PxpB [Paraburkholderia kirstenboschensis]|uniref:5-oxoprolinase subunit PxpB n=1 Tax=Paraburkholderia kirstenboschensis TaxID=1245436 RepID=A0ABZ0EIG8_9BURK|nr:5-oxoprolinase subunit PxpB [Paraburkholderia kirstenboschensis]WOD17007.1 5-oxoprolinase subunit PxpB [Paraburkholderia kirstenboschensis]
MSSIESTELKVSCLGSSAVLCESLGPLDITCQARFWALAQVVSRWPEVAEVVPGMNNLMVVLTQGEAEPLGVVEKVRREWPHVAPAHAKGKVVEVPVVYGGDGGPDLEFVASHTGIDVETVIKLHTQPDYTVYFLGAHPGFGYLGGLDSKLHTPRLDKPRLSVPAGSVAIGGVQTGVIALTSPSGWRLIGHAEQDFFDPYREPPALLTPGDTVRFQCIRAER